MADGDGGVVDEHPGEPYPDARRRNRTAAALAMTVAVALVLVSPDVQAQSPATSDRQIDETLTAVRALIDAGKARDAAATLEGLGRPDDPRIAHLLGVAAYHADDYARAISTLNPLERRFPEGSTERHEIVQVLGLSLFLAGRLDEA